MNEQPFDSDVVWELYYRYCDSNSCILDIIQIVLKTTDPETKQQVLRRYNEFVFKGEQRNNEQND